MKQLLKRFFGRLFGLFRKHEQYPDLAHRTFADLGIDEQTAQSLSSAPSDIRERMQGIAEAHGLNPGAIDMEHWRAVDMAVTCSHCNNRRRCAKFLAEGGDVSEIETFCPNAEQYKELVSLQRMWPKR